MRATALACFAGGDAWQTCAVDVDGVRHTADHVVLATGSDPIIPPIPGLRELEGVGRTGRSPARATLKIYKGYPHGMATVYADVINADLLAFIKD